MPLEHADPPETSDAIPAANNSFEVEMTTYHQHLDALLREHQGKFVVIQGQKILGPFDTYPDALQAGYNAFGLGSFLVKPITAHEKIETIFQAQAA